MIDNPLLHLKRVDDGSPATEVRPTVFSGPVLAVEPGDATHYEVLLQTDLAIGVVGSIYDAVSANLLVLVANAGGKPVARVVRGQPRLSDPHSTALLTYFCSLALGFDVPEPEELSRRRK